MKGRGSNTAKGQTHTVHVVRAVGFWNGSDFSLSGHGLKYFGKEKLSEFNFLTQVNLFLEVTIEGSFGLYAMFYAYSFHIT